MYSLFTISVSYPKMFNIDSCTTMLVFEAKLRGTDDQYAILDEMIRTARFVRNSCLRYWMDNRGVNRYDLNKYCKVLREQFEW
jgi:putative transposase